MSALVRIRAATTLAAERRGRDAADGREVVGYFSPPVPPPEVIEAAGAIPYRLLSSSGPDADLRGMGALGRDSCSFCRSVLGSAVLESPPVTMLASGTACDRLRHMTDSWPAATGLPAFTVTIPRTREVPGQVPVLAAELRLLALEISARTGVQATDDLLGEAIVRNNRCREILSALDVARREDSPRFSGAEFLDVVRAYHAVSSAEFLELADGLLDEVRAREPGDQRPVRVLLVGPTLTDGARDVIRITENDCGARIVGDLTDSGALGYTGRVDEDGDPFNALADQVLAHPIVTSPLLPADGFRAAFRETIRQSRPDGVIFRGVPFCRPFNSAAVPLRDLSPVPFLDVRVEASGANGQIRTRIGAFLEAIEARLHFARRNGE